MSTQTHRIGADVIAEELAAAGITRTYGISGQRILPLWHALDVAGIAIVLARHEQGAAYMADADARVSGVVGVAMSTSGPGAINLLGGAAAAWMDSVPLLLITAQAETTEFGRYGIQEGTGRGRTPGIQQMFGATVKKSWQPHTVEEVQPMLAAALRLAVSGRPGPVHVDIPSDLFTTRVPDGPAPARKAPPSPGPRATRDEVAAVVDALRRAERPLVLAGGGLGAPDVAHRLLEVARACDIPVAGTFAAKRYLDEHDPLVLGPIGIYGRAAANHALHTEADLVLAVGVAFSWLSTAGWVAALPPERLIRVDIDQRELRTNYTAGLSIHAEAGLFLDALAEQATGIAGDGAARVARMRAERPDGQPGDATPSGYLHPIQVCDAVNRHLDERTTAIADIGQNAYWVERHLRTRGDNRFVINAGLGAMGHAVAGALGVWRARTEMDGPDERVVVTTGDGGFLMLGMELSAAVAERAAITWVVFNNGTLGTQSAWFDREGHRRVAVDLPPTDFVAFARALGAKGRRVTDAAALDDALAWAAERRGPIVLDVVIDPTIAPAPFTAPAVTQEER